MGQISLPVLNRTGFSMFWQSVWDDQTNFKRSLMEDLFLKNIFPKIFLDRISSKQFFVTPVTLHNCSALIAYDEWNSFNYRKNYDLENLSRLITHRPKIRYPFKLWIIRFQNWVCFFFCIYSSESKKKNFWEQKVYIFKRFRFLNFFSNFFFYIKYFQKWRFKRYKYKKYYKRYIYKSLPASSF